MIANGLPIPESLIILIQLGRWQAGYQETPLEHIQRFAPEEHKLFFDRPPFGKPEGSLGNLDYFRGEPDEEAPPGDIDFARAVIIGDFGHGSDAPIALDYRKSLDNPSVIRYRWSP